MKRRRPFGVTVIALLQALSAPVAGGSLALSHLDVKIHVDRDLLDNLAGLAVSILGLLIAVGLWQLRRWAWIAAMLWTGAGLAAALLAYVNGKPEYGVMAMGIAVVIYLNQRDVQLAFGRQADAA